MRQLIDFFYEIGALRRLKRTYHLYVADNTESVAEHSHRALVIAYFLAKKLGLDAGKAALMAGFHDMAESRMGDSDWLQKQYMDQDEEKALNAQLNPLGKLADGLKDILHEYKVRKSLESRIAKDADNVEYVLSLKELEMAGNLEAKRRLHSENTSVEHLYTPLAKKIVNMIKKSNPTDWTRQDLIKTFKKYKKQTNA